MLHFWNHIVDIVLVVIVGAIILNALMGGNKKPPQS